MTSPQTAPAQRRPLVTRFDPLRLCDFIGCYRQELGCSHEEAAFASADIFRKIETRYPQLSANTCWAAEVLDQTARRSTRGFQTARLIRYFELQALSKSKREPFILVEDDLGVEFLASDAAAYFSPPALTGLIEEYWSWDQIPRFIHADVSGNKQGDNAQPAAREHLRTRELLTVQRLTGALVAMLTACASQENARRTILNSTLCTKEGQKQGPFSTAEGLTYIADRLGISDFPDTDTVAKYLPPKQSGT
ncbi:hypothetical protein DM872_07905 [Pseudomonas taiwanensis]|uniref:hypothetical protein n=1 Tax=Pseudomonas taiwanensis TaxID=470150 RepID=UPI0015BA175F|nr:hypothetical protein [Pseudomonas taiwanensis]NWL76769.1 hypothetical protein [Pseudomonas taiwanensis]